MYERKIGVNDTDILQFVCRQGMPRSKIWQPRRDTGIIGKVVTVVTATVNTSVAGQALHTQPVVVITLEATNDVNLI